MKFLEKDLEEIIFTSNKFELFTRGLYIPPKLKRQLRIGNYGIADLIGFDIETTEDGYFNKRMKITVYELKQEKVSVSAFLQALRYAKGIKRYLDLRYGSRYDDPYFNLVLIGSSIDLTSDICYLPDLVSSDKISVQLLTYSYEINGLKFKHHKGYKLSREGFKGYED